VSVDYIQAAKRLHEELLAFNETLQHTPHDHTMLQRARRQLETVVAQMELLGEDPGEAWESLSVDQRWGYLRVASLLGTAAHELRRLEVKL